jgi:hypothetical protein
MGCTVLLLFKVSNTKQIKIMYKRKRGNNNNSNQKRSRPLANQLRVAKSKLRKSGGPPAPIYSPTKWNKPSSDNSVVKQNGAGTIRQMGKSMLYGLGTALLGPAAKIFQPVIDTGCDYLGSYLSGSSNNGVLGTAGVPGEIVQTYVIAPGAMSNTRISKMAQLYQRFFFNRVTVKYLPAINVTQSGQMIGFFDTDPEQVAPPGIAGVNYANAHGGTIFQIAEPATFIMPVVRDRTFYCDFDGALQDDEERFKIQAIFYAMVVSAVPASTSIGTFTIEYSCEFELPQIDSSDVSNSVGYYGYSPITVAAVTAASSRFFQTQLAAATFVSATLTGASSANGRFYGTWGDGLGQNGIYFDGSDSGLGPFDAWTPGYYTLAFTAHLSSGTLAFGTLSTAANVFKNYGDATFTSIGNSAHYSSVAAIDCFVAQGWKISGSSQNKTVFDPICTTVAAVITDISMMVCYGPTAFIRNKKGHQIANLRNEVGELRSLLEAHNANMVHESFEQVRDTETYIHDQPRPARRLQNIK